MINFHKKRSVDLKQRYEDEPTASYQSYDRGGHHDHSCPNTAVERWLVGSVLLWRAVLTQIEEDILKPIRSCIGNSFVAYISSCWIVVGETDDFITICEYAREDPYATRRRIIAKAEKDGRFTMFGNVLEAILFRDSMEHLQGRRINHKPKQQYFDFKA